ncbi:MAG: phytanoyl-CoA dioxygenase family protein [Rhodospirillaceae bacterium]|nr:phytanoyl-CoA dioxygenase family protein [Rhodospirillaceae bacterium]
MISDKDVETYNRRGYLVVPNVLSEEEVVELRQVTEEFVEKSRAVSQHTDVYDLEPGHTKDAPKVRRIKTPHAWHPVYEKMVKHPKILSVLQRLWGPNIRFDVSKLNLKSAGFGSPIEWHQDWAFYPHTNDDLAAVGIMIDDFTPENGAMMVIPGSHKGPTYDHHTNGYFVGGIDPSKSNIDFSKAVQCLGKAGSITIHHVRLLHASAANISGAPRRFLLHQYRTADAWPLIYKPESYEKWEQMLVCGEDTLAPRMKELPIRLPYPPAPNQGSIYENQRDLETKFFKTADELAEKKLEPAE